MYWLIYHYDLSVRLKVSSSDTDRKNSSCLWLLFAWYTFSLSFYLQPICVFESVFLLKTAHGTVLCFHSVSQSSLCTFNDIPDMIGFMPIILLFVFLCLMSLFFSFTALFYIKCVFMNYFNLALHSFLLCKSYFFSDCSEGL